MSNQGSMTAKAKSVLFSRPKLSIPIAATLVSCLTACLIGNTEQFGHVPYYYMQFLPVRALREEFLLSIYNLHSQLPLENILFGLIVNLFRGSANQPEYANDFWRGDPYWIGVALKQAIFVWLILYSSFRVYRAYLNKRAAIFLTFFIALLPSTMMFFLFPYSALMCASIYAYLACNILTEAKTQKRLLITATCIMLLGLSHNLFSYYTTFPLIIVLGLELIRHRKKLNNLVALALALILLLPIFWMAKNFITFGITNLTSWSGCALNQSMSPHMTGMKDASGKEITGFHGWKEAHAKIQIPADYDPNLEIATPLALNQRMKGEGVRNWNHKSVITSCKSSKEESLKYLLSLKTVRDGFLNATFNRLWDTSGKLGSEFACPGCGFGYNFLGFGGVGKVVNAINAAGVKQWPVRLWTAFALVVSPIIGAIRFSRVRKDSTSSKRLYMASFMMVNIFVVLMAVSLSTIENERMLWMLMPASNIILGPVFSKRLRTQA